MMCVPPSFADRPTSVVYTHRRPIFNVVNRFVTLWEYGPGEGRPRWVRQLGDNHTYWKEWHKRMPNLAPGEFPPEDLPPELKLQVDINKITIQALWETHIICACKRVL